MSSATNFPSCRTSSRYFSLSARFAVQWCIVSHSHVECTVSHPACCRVHRQSPTPSARSSASAEHCLCLIVHGASFAAHGARRQSPMARVHRQSPTSWQASSQPLFDSNRAVAPAHSFNGAVIARYRTCTVSHFSVQSVTHFLARQFPHPPAVAPVL
jgi:hypothetical protein